MTANEPHRDDAGARGRIQELRHAFAFLTRLPTGAGRESRLVPLSATFWAFPVVGAAIGAMAALVFAVGSLAGLSAWLAAVLAVGIQILVTGALHEDGLGDVADGFGGGGTREHKLEIMRDSRSGTYAICAVGLALMARIGALAALMDPAVVAAALIASGAVSRGFLPALTRILPPARADGLGAAAEGAPSGAARVAGALAVVLASVLMTVNGLLFAIAIVVGAAAVLAVGMLAKRQVGGLTGDVLGAAQQVVEVAILMVAVMALS